MSRRRRTVRCIMCGKPVTDGGLFCTPCLASDPRLPGDDEARARPTARAVG